MLIHSPYELAMLIRSRRKKLKLTQKEVSDLVGLKQKTISAIENNPENIKISTLFRVLAALETNIKLLPKNEPGETKDQWNDEW
ncbi:helix-turn-helix domain-containing protein [Legionella oakridgensis]|uniref:Putative transcriptional regulator with C-terminal CBS domains n=2 Tax=Legionella oakridgensis TaxID=29423 RepID=W0BFQ7_9GAMM|nr:helix-turn-helix domain-containing protein [Legionella oakridgensis]AHE67536.1 putative transcriptional regulator with C-terminal CBS domains [Legionella oakridgensis ATCC 33761 = DSM 21215]ETO92784.1 putative transcriptional regulator [Legionella oakridgensis RV-2-2007]KTD37109.1 putative DNA-binding transcriptional regulator [Legionella oakridgensis]STY20581.1 DNA-binding transcriptional regulator [Legionella longbeachae]